uniref:Uncharacterized protein n=1 Tax=Arundo donax TaxID=35708 RepID=A0A0A8Z1I3_ARUDO
MIETCQTNFITNTVNWNCWIHLSETHVLLVPMCHADMATSQTHQQRAHQTCPTCKWGPHVRLGPHASPRDHTFAVGSQVSLGPACRPQAHLSTKECRSPPFWSW